MSIPEHLHGDIIDGLAYELAWNGFKRWAAENMPEPGKGLMLATMEKFLTGARETMKAKFEEARRTSPTEAGPAR